MFWTMTNGGQKLNICSLLRVTSSEFENEYLCETFTEDMPLAKTRNSKLYNEFAERMRHNKKRASKRTFPSLGNSSGDLEPAPADAVRTGRQTSN